MGLGDLKTQHLFFIVSTKNNKMTKKYKLGIIEGILLIVGGVLAFTGVLFKFFSWQGASTMLMLGFIGQFLLLAAVLIIIIKVLQAK